MEPLAYLQWRETDQSARSHRCLTVHHCQFVIGIDDHRQKGSGVGIGGDKGEIPLLRLRASHHAFHRAAPQDVAADALEDRIAGPAIFGIGLFAGQPFADM